MRSGQLNLPAGFEHWLIKFDGVKFNGDWGVSDPVGYGLLEYSYYQIALRCGITMAESRLFSENNRHHFMTRRFDRDAEGWQDVYANSGCSGALRLFCKWLLFLRTAVYGDEATAIPTASIEQQFRRVLFNLVGCNQDDHVKNFAFTMDRRGQWDISPAYDLCHAEGSDFTRHHQLSINGKTHGFTLADLKHLAAYAGLPRGREKRILAEVLEAFSGWPALARELEIPERLIAHVGSTLRMKWV